MWAHPSGRQGQLRYYYCAGRDHRTCAVPLIRAEPVEAQALEMVKALALPGEWQAAIMRQITALRQPRPSKPAISKEMVEAQLKRLALVYAAGDIDEATYQRQRAAWRKQLEESGAPMLPSAYNPRRAFEVLSDLANLLDGANVAQQRSVLRHIFATLWLAPHRVAAMTPTDLYAPMLAAVETLRGKDGDMGCPTGFGCRIQTSSKRSPCATYPLPTGRREIWRGTSKWLCCVGRVGIRSTIYAHCS